MKKVLLSTVGLIALSVSAPALAADMAVKAIPPPVVAPIYNWSGFYIGANGGWGEPQLRGVSCNAVAGPVFGDGCRDRSGGLFGGQIGYRWQSNQFVFGLEAQGDWADLSNTRVSLFNPALSTRVKTDGIGLFTGQIGWAAWSAALFYLKGGAAVTGNRFTVLDTATGARPGFVECDALGRHLGCRL